MMKQRDDNKWCSASDLAEMGVCERRILLAAKHGKRKSAEQQAASKRGDLAHEEFYRESLRDAPATDSPKPWCFIASAAFGPAAPETVLLRRFRDRCMRPHRVGRSLIRTYYRLSPPVGRFVGSRPWAWWLARAVLRPAIVLAWLTVGSRK